MLKPLLACLALSSLLSACGASYDTEKVKSYRLTVVNGDANWVREFKVLIQDYNRFAGLPVLSYADNAADANSAIVISEGLRQKSGGNVGYGQWLTESEADDPFATFPGQKVQKTITYAMHLTFDAEYFRSRMSNPDARQHREKQTLFFHEVGHGLEMPHNVGGDSCSAQHTAEDERNVMFCDVNGEKDFDAYFVRVRSYMSDR